MQDNEAHCALLTHGYLASLPEGMRVEAEWIRWRPQTHRYFPIHIRRLVWCALLCWKRVCPQLPRDLRTHMLSLSLVMNWRAHWRLETAPRFFS